MKNQYKSVLVLVVTLFIGMILGALIHGTIMQKRIKDTAFRMRAPFGLLHILEDVVDLDDSQQEAVREILKKHQERMSRSRREVRAMMDSLRKELEPILTQEQLERLNNRPWFPRGKELPPPPFPRMRPGMRRRPPPHPDSLNVPSPRE